jgi:NAD(P)H-dependent FMN reductase
VTRILGISGSLRKGSYNAALLRTAKELAPDGVELEIGSIAGIPLFNQDVQESEGVPPAVITLKERLAEADGLLLVTPEYNHGIPGVFKNAIDWSSRPADDIPKVFGDLPVAVIGAGGLAGTRFAQTGFLLVFRYLHMRPWLGQTLFVDRAWERFDDSGELTDADIRERLGRFMTEFAAFCAELPRRRAP